jgi:hypothetical protein
MADANLFGVLLRERLGWVLATVIGVDAAACSSNDGECSQYIVDGTSTVTVDVETACAVQRALDLNPGSITAQCQKACGAANVSSCMNDSAYQNAYFSTDANGSPAGTCPSAQLLDGGTSVQLTCTAAHYQKIPGSVRPCGTGRRPEGLEPCNPSTPSDVGAWLASAAYLEAASVSAFVLLTDELAAHSAPRHLVDGARQAAREEESHAASMTAVARHYGAVVQEAPSVIRRSRTLLEIATENAREGVVRETYGAVVMLSCAQRAPTAALRAMFAKIRARNAHTRSSAGQSPSGFTRC